MGITHVARTNSFLVLRPGFKSETAVDNMFDWSEIRNDAMYVFGLQNTAYW